MITAEQLGVWGNTLGDVLHIGIDVGTTSAEAVPPVPEKIRVKLTLTNTGENTVYLGVGQPARVGYGPCLFPGATWQLDRREGYNGQIFAIAAGGTSHLSGIAAHRSTLEAL